MQIVPEKKNGFFFDTVTLSNFALSDCAHLLVERYGNLARVTPEVLGEITEGIAAGYSKLRVIETAVVEGKLGSADPLSLDEREIYRELLQVLSPGEASCIARARSQGGIVVTDDRKARDCCTDRSVNFTGTIGILIASVRDEGLSSSEADAILQRMIDAGYYSPVNRISSVL